jgi:hypothetical protein
LASFVFPLLFLSFLLASPSSTGFLALEDTGDDGSLEVDLMRLERSLLDVLVSDASLRFLPPLLEYPGVGVSLAAFLIVAAGYAE